MSYGYERIGDVVKGLFTLVIVLACVSVPLAIWKCVDIIAWIFSHVTIGVR